jgi:TolB protein
MFAKKHWIPFSVLLISVMVASCAAQEESPSLNLTQQGTPSNAELQAGENEQIAFTSFREGRDEYFEIYVINNDGTGLHKINTGDLGASNAAWSPDGEKIAFNSDRDDGNTEIYVVNVDGTSLERLTRNPADDLYPAWSPDGTQIAFYSSDYTDVPMLFVMNADGSNIKRIIDLPTTPGGLDWSPDGKTIVFNSIASISIVNKDGSTVRDLTEGTSTALSWSPEGSQILFDRFDEAGNSDIYVMNADGSGILRLTSNPDPHLYHAPDWSPDGTRITFTCGELDEICVMNSDGSEIANVTNDAAFDSSPVWRPSALPSGAVEAAIQGTQVAEDAKRETESASALAAFSPSQMVGFAPGWFQGDIPEFIYYTQNKIHGDTSGLIYFDDDHWVIKARDDWSLPGFFDYAEWENGTMVNSYTTLFGVITPIIYDNFDITATFSLDPRQIDIGARNTVVSYECIVFGFVDANNNLEFCILPPFEDQPGIWELGARADAPYIIPSELPTWWYYITPWADANQISLELPNTLRLLFNDDVLVGYINDTQVFDMTTAEIENEINNRMQGDQFNDSSRAKTQFEFVPGSIGVGCENDSLIIRYGICNVNVRLIEAQP